MRHRRRVSLTLIVLGVILGGLGWWHHGGQAVAWDHEAHALRVARSVSRHVKPAAYQNIEIVSPVPVTVKPGNTNQVTVRYLKGTKTRPHVVVDGPTLKITGGQVKAKTATLLGGKASVGAAVANPSGVLVTVPKDTQLDRVNVAAKSGSVSLQGIKANRVTVADSADLTLQGLTVAKQLQVHSTTGDVWLDDVRAGQLAVQTLQGDIGLTNVQSASTNTALSSTDGDVSVAGVKLKTSTINAVKGDVRLTDNQVAGKLSVTTQSGDVRARIRRSTGVDIATVKGDVKVNDQSRSHKARWHTDATNQLGIKATSGDVTITNK